MDFPVRCFGCHAVINNKHYRYIELKRIQCYVNDQEKQTDNEIFEILKIKRPCCKNHFLTHTSISSF